MMGLAIGSAVPFTGSLLAAPHSGGPLHVPALVQEWETSERAPARAPSAGPAHGVETPQLERALREIQCLEWFSSTSVLEASRPLGRAEVLARFDRDHDGRLSLLEKRHAERDAAQRVARRGQLIESFDANGNGRLEAIEMSRARAASVAERRALWLEHFDADRDGVLGPRERRAISLERERASRLERLIPHFDRDGDRRLSQTEKFAMARFLAATES